MATKPPPRAFPASPFPPVGLTGNNYPWSDPNLLSGPGPTPPGNATSIPQGAAQPTPTDQTPVIDYQKFAKLIDNTVGAGLASIKFLVQTSTKRNFLALRNPNATANLFIGFGADATSMSTIALAPGVLIIFDAVVPQDDLYVISDTAAQTLAYAYSTYGG